MQNSQAIEVDTDQQLVELAGKAIGYVIVPHTEERMHSEHQVMYSFAIETPFGLKGWNPLVDAGQALHLAIECDIEVAVNSVEGNSYARLYHPDDYDPWLQIVERHADHKDKHAATRRAIARAAAEGCLPLATVE